MFFQSSYKNFTLAVNIYVNKSFNATKYKNDFAKEHYDRINLTIPKGIKDKIKAAAKTANMSTNEYILTAIIEKMGK